MYGYGYDDMVQDLASDMLDKIAEEIEYEDGFERTAGIREIPGRIRTAVKDRVTDTYRGDRITKLKMDDFGPAAGSNTKKGASAGIRKFKEGISPQNAIAKVKGLSVPKKMVAAGGVGVGVAGLGYGHMKRNRINSKGQEKAAEYFEEAEIYKQAAEEAYEEALAMEEAALNLYDYFE